MDVPAFLREIYSGNSGSKKAVHFRYPPATSGVEVGAAKMTGVNILEGSF